MESKFKTHPAADCFPMMRGAAYERLRDDIAANGLLFPVKLCSHEGEWTILDGRNRARACDELGIKYKTEVYDGKTPIKYVVSANLARRDLTDWERHEAANALADLVRGRPSKSAQSADLTQSDVADAMELSDRTMRKQKYAKENAAPEVVEAAAAGEISINAAHEIAHLPVEEQTSALEAKRNGERKPAPIDPHVTKAARISDEDIAGLAALVRFGENSPNHAARHGAEVIKRIVPAVRS